MLLEIILHWIWKILYEDLLIPFANNFRISVNVSWHHDIMIFTTFQAFAKHHTQMRHQLWTKIYNMIVLQNLFVLLSRFAGVQNVTAHIWLWWLKQFMELSRIDGSVCWKVAFCFGCFPQFNCTVSAFKTFYYWNMNVMGRENSCSFGRITWVTQLFIIIQCMLDASQLSRFVLKSSLKHF